MKTNIAILFALLISTNSFTYAKDLAKEKDINCYALTDNAVHLFEITGSDIDSFPWMGKIAVLHTSMEKRVNEKYVVKMRVEK